MTEAETAELVLEALKTVKWIDEFISSQACRTTNIDIICIICFR